MIPQVINNTIKKAYLTISSVSYTHLDVYKRQVLVVQVHTDSLAAQLSI